MEKSPTGDFFCCSTELQIEFLHRTRGRWILSPLSYSVVAAQGDSLTASMRQIHSQYSTACEYCVKINFEKSEPNHRAAAGLFRSRLCTSCVTLAPFLSLWFHLCVWFIQCYHSRAYLPYSRRRFLTLWFWVNIFQLFTYILFCCNNFISMISEDWM